MPPLKYVDESDSDSEDSDEDNSANDMPALKDLDDSDSDDEYPDSRIPVFRKKVSFNKNISKDNIDPIVIPYSED